VQVAGLENRAQECKNSRQQELWDLLQAAFFVQFSGIPLYGFTAHAPGVCGITCQVSAHFWKNG
jgi:hypothetical protein